MRKEIYNNEENELSSHDEKKSIKMHVTERSTTTTTTTEGKKESITEKNIRHEQSVETQNKRSD